MVKSLIWYIERKVCRYVEEYTIIEQQSGYAAKEQWNAICECAMQWVTLNNYLTRA